MKIEFIGQKKLMNSDDDIQLGIRLTLYLTSENDKDLIRIYDLMHKGKELKHDGIEQEILDVMNEYSPHP